MLKPAVSGFLMQKELVSGEALNQPKRPFLAVLGGAKISGKIDLISALLPQGGPHPAWRRDGVHLLRGHGAGDRKLAGGAGQDRARPTALAGSGDKLVVPSGVVVAAVKSGTETRTVPRDRIPEGWAVFDIDQRTEKEFASRIEQAGTVIWNGPMGVFETPPFDHRRSRVAAADHRHRPVPGAAAIAARSPGCHDRMVASRKRPLARSTRPCRPFDPRGELFPGAGSMSKTAQSSGIRPD